MAQRVILSAFTALVLAGCAAWNEPLEEPSELPPLRPSASDAMLDVAFIGLQSKSTDLSGVWRELDEQHVPADVRRRLSDNGIRCGMIGPQLPTALETLIESGSQSLPGTKLPQGVTIQRIQCPAGEGRQVVVSGLLEEIVVLQTDGQQVRGQPYRQAQCLLNLRCQPRNDGRVDVEIVPEIQHGDPHKHYVGSQGVIQYVIRPDKEAFDQMKLQATLSPGQSLLLTCTDDPKGLGKSFFTERSGGDWHRKMMLIRLAYAPGQPLYREARGESIPLADDWQ